MCEIIDVEIIKTDKEKINIDFNIEKYKNHARLILLQKKFLPKNKNTQLVTVGDTNLMTFDDTYFNDIKKYSTNNK